MFFPQLKVKFLKIDFILKKHPEERTDWHICIAAATSSALSRDWWALPEIWWHFLAILRPC